MNVIQLIRRTTYAFALAACVLAFAGCGSDPVYTELPHPAQTGDSKATASSQPGILNPEGSDLIQVGDLITVQFPDLPGGRQDFQKQIPESGSITLLYNKPFQTIGKTPNQLEQEIRTNYVPAYFVNLTINVIRADRFFYINGQVRSPGRQAYTGPITVLKAIATAGDFTDFAKKTNVKVTRMNGMIITVDCSKALKDPTLDIPILPNDKIYIPRRIF